MYCDDFFKDFDRVKIQQKLDSVYGSKYCDENSELPKITAKEELLMEKIPKLRDVFEDSKVVRFSKREVKGLLEYQLIKQEEFNECENIAYYTGAKGMFEYMKKLDLIK